MPNMTSCSSLVVATEKHLVKVLGDSSSSGICHTYTEDGRCVVTKDFID
jgi:predicted DNA-binding helix-hairpin-helix protein